jgi:hypothetical protein
MTSRSFVDLPGAADVNLFNCWSSQSRKWRLNCLRPTTIEVADFSAVFGSAGSNQTPPHGIWMSHSMDHENLGAPSYDIEQSDGICDTNAE